VTTLLLNYIPVNYTAKEDICADPGGIAKPGQPNTEMEQAPGASKVSRN